MPNIAAPDASSTPAKQLPPINSTMEPPKKRARLPDDAYGAIVEQRLEDIETALEVDYMILDYLLYQAITTCFANPHTPLGIEISDVERCLVQVDEFFALFKMRYGDCKFDPDMKFRLLLCQIVPLFTQRLTPNSTTPSKERLRMIRQGNVLRARDWIGEADRVPTVNHDIEPFESSLPIDKAELERNRVHVLETVNVPEEDDEYEENFYGTSASLSLLDLLPLFMKITAACNDMFGIGVGNDWMQLAADLMLSACLEQYLIYGASGSDAMDEAFAWGFKSEYISRDDQENDEFSYLFEGGEEGGQEVEGWQEIRDRTLQQLLTADADIASHLSRLASLHPLARTHKSVNGFLRSLGDAIPKPVLVQLEGGQLDGMSKEETQDFIRSCKLDLTGLFP